MLSNRTPCLCDCRWYAVRDADERGRRHGGPGPQQGPLLLPPAAERGRLPPQERDPSPQSQGREPPDLRGGACPKDLRLWQGYSHR